MDTNDSVYSRFLKPFVSKTWYVPSDVIQRSIEAKIWSTYKIKHPVLEIGSGDGELSRLVFSRLKFIDVGVDIDTDAIKRAKKCKFYKKVICADSAKLPFKSKSFTTVVANSTFEHVDSLKPSIIEIYRVLKKDGVFIFSVPLKDFHFSLLKSSCKGKLERLNKRLHHVNYYNENEWKRMLKEAGFKRVVNKGYFSEETLNIWNKFLVISTLRIGNSEIWSLMKKYFDRSIVISGIFKFLLSKYVPIVVYKKEKGGDKMMTFFYTFKK